MRKLEGFAIAMTTKSYKIELGLTERTFITWATQLWLAVIVVASSVLPADAEPSEERGKTFAQTNCSQCHSIDRSTPSSLAIAPPFRDLHLRYPVESLEEALAEGIVTGHPTMPEFQLDPGQVTDFIKFLKSFERRKRAG